MPRQRSMAFKARIPTPTALEFDRNNIPLALPMRATRLLIHVRTKHFNAMYQSHRFIAAASLR